MKKPILALLVLTVALPPSVFAVGSGGFENATYSAKFLGQSNAGVAQADEPAAISYNPAGITQLPGIQVQGNAAFISIFTRHTGRQDGVSYSSGTINTVPTAYATINPGKYLNNRLVFGVGSDSPFGLGNKYDANLPQVRYAGWKNWLKMYTIKPVVAVKVNDWLSIGGGPMYYRIFDFGGIQAYPNIVAAAQGLTAVTADGQVRLNLSGNRWGWQWGALLKPHKMHQLGFYFRSPVTVHTRGVIKVERGAGARSNFETGGQDKIDLPLNFTVGYAFKPTDRTTVETDFGYTRWQAFERSYINADPVSAADDVVLAAIGKADKDYEDAFSLHLGGNHKLNDKLTLLAGALFYWTPVPNVSYIPAVPDSNSVGFSAGASYALSRNILAELTYFNRLWLRRNIDNNVSESLGTTMDGKYFSVLNEFIISFTYKWENIFGGAEKKEKEADITTKEDRSL